MDSILTSIKKLLGIDEEYTHFDPDIIMHINSVLATLNQVGVGPRDGFLITDSSSTWSDFLGNDPNIASAISYVYLKVKLLFDPPTNSSLIDSINRLLSEFEWRLFVATDPVEVNGKEETKNGRNSVSPLRSKGSEVGRSETKDILWKD